MYMFDIGFADLSVPPHLQIGPPIKYIKKEQKKEEALIVVYYSRHKEGHPQWVVGFAVKSALQYLF